MPSATLKPQNNIKFDKCRYTIFQPMEGKGRFFTNSVEKGVSQPSRVLDEDKRDLRFGNYRTIEHIRRLYL
jgi:hypothetical protein